MILWKKNFRFVVACFRLIQNAAGWGEKVGKNYHFRSFERHYALLHHYPSAQLTKETKESNFSGFSSEWLIHKPNIYNI